MAAGDGADPRGEAVKHSLERPNRKPLKSLRNPGSLEAPFEGVRGSPQRCMSIFAEFFERGVTRWNRKK
jgi:hypothetical protein